VVRYALWETYFTSSLWELLPVYHLGAGWNEYEPIGCRDQQVKGQGYDGNESCIKSVVQQSILPAKACQLTIRHRRLSGSENFREQT